MPKLSRCLSERNDTRQKLIVLGILGLTLLSAALDRRNVVYGRDTTEAQPAEHWAAPSTGAMLQDMLGHD